MKLYKTVMFVQISECQAPLHKVFIWSFFGNNGYILTPSMSSHSSFIY